MFILLNDEFVMKFTKFLEVSKSVDVAKFALDIARRISVFHAEGSIRRFEAEGVGAVLI